MAPKGSGKRGTYVQDVNGIRKVFDYPSHILKDAREKMDPWLKNFKSYPETLQEIRLAQSAIKLTTAADLDKATEQKPLIWEIKTAPMKAVVRIWTVK